MEFGFTLSSMGMPTQVLVPGSRREELLSCIQILLSAAGEQHMNITKAKHLRSVKQPGLCKSTG